MSEEQLMEKIREMAESNVVVRTLLNHSGHPDNWPTHLKQDLFNRLGIESESKVYKMKATP
jgi:hypothetical protein